MQQALQAPNADVQTVALSLAQSNPAYATQLLQAAIDLAGGDTNVAASDVKAFGDLAATLVAPGPGQNPDLAAALAVAVEKSLAILRMRRSSIAAFAATVATANAETQSLLQNPAIQQAILNNAPGTQGAQQAANGPGAGGPGPGFTPPSSGPNGGTPTHP